MLYCVNITEYAHKQKKRAAVSAMPSFLNYLAIRQMRYAPN